MRFLPLAAAAVLLSASLLAHADVAGDSFSGTFNTPDASTVALDLGTLTAPGSGAVAGLYSYQITGSQVILTDLNSNGLLDGPFTGFEFKDLTEKPMFSAVTLDTAASSAIFDGAPIASFTSDTLSFNFANLAVSSGDTAVFNLSFAPPATAVTPEPSSILLLGTGLLGVAGVVRRRLV